MIHLLTQPQITDEVRLSEHVMSLWDGTELFYRGWIPTEPTRKSLVIFHRGHEHSGRFEDVVRDLRLGNVAVFAWDARGHGRSAGSPGYAPDFSYFAKDADCFVHHISQKYSMPLKDMVVLGHSIGAVVAVGWVHDYAPPVRAMVLVTPAWRVRLYVPFARTGMRLVHSLLPRRPVFVSSYVKGPLLTHDAEQRRRYDDDPLISHAIAVNVLLGMHDTAARLIADAGAIRTPTLVLAGGRDWVVDLSAEREFFDRLGSDIKRLHVFDGMYHDILHETDRHLVLNQIRGFVRGAFAAEDLTPSPDHGAYTRNEYERLRLPLPRFSPKRFRFAARRVFLRTIGRLSDGVRIGWRTGFDSGSSLDYVYENRPRGALLLGRIIDRIYLNSVGWLGIRERKANIEMLLREAIECLSDTGVPVHILDVAAGQGRYVLETLATVNNENVTAVLRDYVQDNLEAARARAVRLGLRGVAFERADAFDEGSYSALEPRPNIAIVSGLLELFPDNALVRRCLEGLAQTIEDGGYLIYTGQPWHPQIEMIARVLTNRDGEPWVMRRRTQVELDGLVREAGFEKLRTKVDNRGIFTVSVAKRRSSGGSVSAT